MEEILTKLEKSPLLQNSPKKSSWLRTFSKGLTQVLSTTTLGTPSDVEMDDLNQH